jgi:hypothetical protein
MYAFALLSTPPQVATLAARATRALATALQMVENGDADHGINGINGDMAPGTGDADQGESWPDEYNQYDREYGSPKRQQQQQQQGRQGPSGRLGRHWDGSPKRVDCDNDASYNASHWDMYTNNNNQDEQQAAFSEAAQQATQQATQYEGGRMRGGRDGMGSPHSGVSGMTEGGESNGNWFTREDPRNLLRGEGPSAITRLVQEADTAFRERADRQGERGVADRDTALLRRVRYGENGLTY